ncbi:hypothetical protein GGI12_002508 [Dipsacomyces acuminosporus]|nr:hypothetical protein GGI12_002508 [Dipsacomyces acuminosporus]
MYLPLRSTLGKPAIIAKNLGITRAMTHHRAKSLIIDYDFSTKRIKERKSDMSARDFMLSGGSGVYTAMRTVYGGRKLFLLDYHLQRICDSLRMSSLSDRPNGQECQDTGYWRRLLIPLIREGLDKFKCPGESKITILVGGEGVSLQFVHLTVPKSGHCLVRFVPGKRENPHAKSLQWVHEREKLEALITPPINEVVLVEADEQGKEHLFFEGISSNFFATRQAYTDRYPEYLNYQLICAPLDNILLGTVMKSILRICERDGIEVVSKPIVDPEQWSGAFVSSTSRLVLPVSGVVRSDGQETRSLDTENDPLVEHLRLGVLSLVNEQSTAI